MSLLNLKEFGTYLAFDEDECRIAGQALSSAYRSAKPFPHVVVDEFVPAEVLRRIGAAYPSREGKAFFDRDQERLKYQFQPSDSDSPLVRNLFHELNSRAFLTFLEEMTGIEGLVPDPYFTGAGLHETLRSGHLSVHADFNLHMKMKLERRLNLLIYLNDEWEEEYGGELELWDTQMKQCEVRVQPVIGRAVVFSTNLDSYHGHPEPLNCPEDRTRRSIATYYYTALSEDFSLQRDHGTNFQRRPNSGDKVDWFNLRNHFVYDWVPPALRRIVRRARRRN